MVPLLKMIECGEILPARQLRFRLSGMLNMLLTGMLEEWYSVCFGLVLVFSCLYKLHH